MMKIVIAGPPHFSHISWKEGNNSRYIWVTGGGGFGGGNCITSYGTSIALVIAPRGVPGNGPECKSTRTSRSDHTIQSFPFRSMFWVSMLLRKTKQ